MNPEELLRKYCADNSALLDILLRHSRSVMEKALAICDRHPELGADRTFVAEAAMLHDIGIVRTDAQGIHCHGTEPYIRHGLAGGEILRSEGLPQHARVAERHTGTGITLEQIQERDLPLPHQDYSPETIEEKIICYADKFFSKTRLDEEKTPEQALKSLWKFGPECDRRFREWGEMFE